MRTSVVAVGAFLALLAACQGTKDQSQETGSLGRGARMQGKVGDGPRWVVALHGDQLRIQRDNGGAVFEGVVPQDGIRFIDRGDAPRFEFALAGAATLKWDDQWIEYGGERYRLPHLGTMIFTADGTVGRATMPWTQWPDDAK